MHSTAKMLFNTITITTLIATVSLTGILGMLSVRRQMQDLTEHSTPIQTGTLNLQLSVQSAYSELITTSLAHGISEFVERKRQAEKTLRQVEAVEHELSGLKGGNAFTVSRELGAAADELFRVTRERITSLENADSARKEFSAIMGTKLTGLTQLDSRIGMLEASRREELFGSISTAMKLSSDVHDFDMLTVSLKEFELAAGSMFRAASRKQAVMARGKAAVAINRIMANNLVREGGVLSRSDIMAAGDSVEALHRIQIALFERPADNRLDQQFDDLTRDIKTRISYASLAIEQRSGHMSELMKYELTRQKAALEKARLSSDILSLSSELKSLGLKAENLTELLFQQQDTSGLTSVSEKLKQCLMELDRLNRQLERDLQGDGSGSEREYLLKAATGTQLLSRLFGEKGIVVRLEHSLRMSEETRKTMGRLTEVTARQAKLGNRHIGEASQAQSRSVSSVTSRIYWSIIAIVITGIASIATELMLIRHETRMRQSAQLQVQQKQQELEQINTDLKNRITTEVEKNRAKDAVLLQNDKLASIGQLAAGIAHEINNPAGFLTSNLNTFKGYTVDITTFINEVNEIIDSECADTVRRKLSERYRQLDMEFILDDLPKLVDESLEGANRVKGIVKDLKDFARPDERGYLEADLNDCIRSTLNIVRNEYKNVAEVRLQLEELPLLVCKPQQINQVITNLLVNAAHSMKGFGVITISTAREGDLLRLVIDDNGSGIPPEVLPHIFDPFFTTKDVGKGTGLGLSITYDIITKHGGNIQVDTEVGTGSRFTVYFPIGGPKDRGVAQQGELRETDAPDTDTLT